MGALLADTPHTRPVPVSASASDPELMARHGLVRSTYEGPTGIVGVLHDSCSRAGLVSASLWAATPHYISAAPNPQAALALLERLAEIAGTPPAAPSSSAQRASTSCGWPRRSPTTRTSPATWSSSRSRRPTADDPPTGEELAADFERYLREQSDEEDD